MLFRRYVNALFMFLGQHSFSESDSEPVQHHTVVAADVHQTNNGELSRRRSGMYFCIRTYFYYDNNNRQT